MSTRRAREWWRDLNEPDPHLGRGQCEGPECGCNITNAQWRAESDNEYALVDFDGRYTSESR